MKAGDAVMYREGERSFNGLVFHVHELPEHLGENGEPLLHLVIVDDNPPRAGIDKQPVSAVQPREKIRYIFDAMHESAPGPTTGTMGRWREIAVKKSAPGRNPGA